MLLFLEIECVVFIFNSHVLWCTDERYQEGRNVAYISKWLRNAIKKYDSFQETMAELQKFFQNAEVLLFLHI